MPDRPTPSDVDGSDLKVSDLKVSGAEAPEPVGSGEVNGGGAGPVAPDAAPSPSAPADAAFSSPRQRRGSTERACHRREARAGGGGDGVR